MKKVVVLSVVLFASVIAMNAQPRAIGVRFGYSTEASYQHSFESGNMLQLDAGFPYFSSFHVVGTYNWLFPISSWKHDGSWNWYAGVGAGVGLGWSYYRWWGYDDVILHYNRYYAKSYGVFGIAGMVGVEYNFKFPLQLFVDYRPLIGLAISRDEAWFHNRGLGFIAIGARYNFKK